MSASNSNLEHLLQERGIILADGATGSELLTRGVPTPLPLWSAAALLAEGALAVLRQIHQDYLTAGARLITANTFRTHARNLRAAKLEDRARELTELAVSIARQAIARFEEAHSGQNLGERRAAGGILIAGSQAPLEDCYSPELTPPVDELNSEHGQMAKNLAAAGVDLILIETMPTIREAVAAAEAAARTGVPFAVSFVCGSDGLLLSGESLQEAVARVLPCGPRLLGINCTPATKMTAAIKSLSDVLQPFSRDVDLIAYGNIGEPDEVHGWRNTAAKQPDVYAQFASEWNRLGVKVIGGCCGATPEHIAALRREFAK